MEQEGLAFHWEIISVQITINLLKGGCHMDKNKTDSKQLRRVMWASVFGSALEWYDFSIYSSASALVFGSIFFPKFSSAAGILASLATFAIGFFARPIGGVIFGNFGDKYGRKPILVFTLLLMGIATTLIGLLPTYDSIGIWSPILLILLRILQGLGAGAEFGGAVIFCVEYTPKEKRGLYGSLPPMGTFAGILVATGIFNLVAALPKEQYMSWGWRLPFLLSILIVAVGLFIRLRITETPEFIRAKESKKVEKKAPLLEVLCKHPKKVLLVMGSNFVLTGYSYVIQVFLLTYISKYLGLNSKVGLTGVLISSAVSLFTIPLFGALTDRVGRRTVYLWGTAFAIVYAFPLFWILNTKVTLYIWLAQIIGYTMAINSVFAAQASYYAELFQTEFRYSGFVFSREITAAVCGGTAPLIANALYTGSGGSTAISIFMIIMAIISFISVYLLPETLQKDQSSSSVDKNESIDG
jgi:MFS transporter, MHS family, shikimate and dehydroshikimate transport protein